MKRIIFFVSLLLSLSACKSLNPTALLSGGATLAQAPAAQAAIAECVKDDSEAQVALQAPQKFFETGFNVVMERGADQPILGLIEKSPEYFDAIPAQWASIWEVLDGRDCGPVVSQFKANGEVAWEGINKAIEGSDKLKTACTYWASIGPVANMFSPIPLPTRIPGC